MCYFDLDHGKNVAHAGVKFFFCECVIFFTGCITG